MYKLVPLTEKRPERPETSIKDGFEVMEHEFSLEPWWAYVTSKMLTLIHLL